MESLSIRDPRQGDVPAFLRPAAALLGDARDLVFVWLMLKCALVGIAGVALFFAGPHLWYLAPLYWLLLGAWTMDRFILMLHCTSHRPLFKARHRALATIIPWVLGPFHGETPETYFVHHMGMHHREENLGDDLSSTMGYHRDRLSHWLHYWLRFMVLGLWQLAGYHRRKGNTRLLRRLIIGEGAFWLVVAGLLLVNPAATLVVFVGPVVLVRTLMMAGNWGQHAFVCAQQPGNPYRSSITCINTRYNRRCFNDGYHIHHHVQARCHYTELPAELERNLARYGAEDALVFDGLDFFQVWLLLMLKRWRRLARAVVQLPGAPARDESEMIAFLKQRTQPIEPTSARAV